MSLEQKYAVLWHTSEYRGDHTADICRVLELKPRETVIELATRVGLRAPDRIEIRPVERDL